ncbi:reversion-inducing cysteine-rich protein with Kazal motifs [Latimeria chalumnae]|uniref:Reversion-inducing cysteine-rich protein with Kazal motifs n=1 Tax=Latimeria chalumnae TaxID=7897 RepID=H3AGG9_LATCH|nr:PREDICTED: reversion-inducing cysteine-rich protein with Kazal motifs [Latimeria chalumnae]|eukprot:XP_006005911.1 PREDICTED: reversion-inducing cysteine-rich protein with Kazal motifs [Latimeria chalumnae]
MFGYMEMISLFLLLHLCSPAQSQDASCCYHARDNPMCRDACEQLTATKSESRLKYLLQRLPEYCPQSMVDFWVCINSTLPGVSKKSDGWVGLGCCELAISTDCRRSCKQASSKNDILKSCKKEHETALFTCVNRNEMGSVCCSYAGKHTNCQEYCRAIFRTDSSPTPSQIKAVKNYCAAISPQLMECVDNYTESYPMRKPVDSLYCCDRAKDFACQTACKRILMTMTTELEIVDGLIEGCKTKPLPQDPLWKCFLINPVVPDPDVIHPPTGIDGAKLQCCSKANTSVCRELCQKLYSTSWGNRQSWQEFDRICEYNPVESSMLTCLADVREPCQLGCKDLTFCTNFNNRPTELFRSCNAQSDQGAMNDMKLWENGSIKMPFMNIPVLNIKTCQPERWKAVACSLQIKPCHSKSRGSVICKSDCVDILKSCGDHSKFPEGQTAETICELLSPTDDKEYCIPLESYLRPSLIDNIVDVIHPCNPSPCPTNQLCVVNRKGCQAGEDCLPYFCVPGCKLGEASDFLVHQEAHIQVPSSTRDNCYKICTCGQSGRLENCKEMPCVEKERTCIVGAQRKDHGTSFRVDCNVCSCFAGKLICSTRQCVSDGNFVEDQSTFTDLPCNCGDKFVPVCAHNGRTYPSACIARCAGMKDNEFEFGSCALKDPCNPNPCPRNKKCIPKHRVCLTNIHMFGCDQFECVSKSVTCDQEPLETVCDTENVEHPSRCVLYQRGKMLSYVGSCQPICRSNRRVCGHNGETYSNLCAAYSDRVAVDYYGTCQAVGVLSGYSSHSQCSSVMCPTLSVSGCKPITPPGACCPLCAGMLRVLFSTDQLNIFSEIIDGRPLTVHDILRSIRLHISVPQCDVFGYFSIESEIVILIVPVDDHPTSLQIEACNKEAEKINSLINFNSPTLVSHVPLSALTTSQVQVSMKDSSCSAKVIPFSLAIFVSLIITLGNSI